MKGVNHGWAPSSLGDKEGLSYRLQDLSTVCGCGPAGGIGGREGQMASVHPSVSLSPPAWPQGPHKSSLGAPVLPSLANAFITNREYRFDGTWAKTENWMAAQSGNATNTDTWGEQGSSFRILAPSNIMQTAKRRKKVCSYLGGPCTEMERSATQDGRIGPMSKSGFIWQQSR